VTIVHVEHPVLDYDRWKAGFDSDPVGREKSGVRRYRVLRAADDPNFVVIDLEVDKADDAERMVASLHALWQRVDGVLISGPRARIFEVAEQT
jgi:hypothetical protein